MASVTRQQAEEMLSRIQAQLSTTATQPTSLDLPSPKDAPDVLRPEVEPEADFFDTASYFFGKGEQAREATRQIPITGPISLLQRGLGEVMPYYGGAVGGAADIAAGLLYDVTPVGEMIQPAMQRETAERKLGRDIYAIAEAGVPELARPTGLVAGKAVSAISPAKPKPVAEQVAETGIAPKDIEIPDTVDIPKNVGESIDSTPVERADVIDPISDIIPFDEAAATEIRAQQPIDSDIFEPKVSVDLTSNVNKAATEMLDAGGITRNDNIKISDQIFELLQTDRITGDQFRNILKENNLTSLDFAQVYRAEVRDAARLLAQLSVASKKYNKLLNKFDGVEGEILETLIDTPVDEFGTGLAKKLRELDNIRRGLLVSQFATTARNVTAQIGRVGMDTLTKALDNTLQQGFSTFVDPLTGKKGRDVDWSGTFDLLMSLTKNKSASKDLTELVLSPYAKQKDRLFLNYASDVANVDGGGLIGKAQKGVNLVNTFNKMQDYYFRRGMFAARLRENLRKKGMDIDDVVAQNRIDLIDKDDIVDAVDAALEFTYSKSPPADSVAGAAINLVNKLPFVMTSVIPFPRFMYNAMKFQFEHSPFGAMRFVSPQQLKLLAKGDAKATKEMSKAIVGSAALLAAIEFRNSEYAGEKWYEAKGPDGTRIDLRPYFPLTPYLLVADTFKRISEGTQVPDGRDIIQGLTGAQFRAGTGVAIVDEAMKMFDGVDDPDRAKRMLTRFAADTLGGYLTPVRGWIKDVVQQEQEYRTPEVTGNILKDVGMELARNLPFAQEALGAPETQVPTREEAPRRVQPFLRQLTGVTATEEKNPAEAEFDRLGLKRRDILPYTGDRNADQLISKYMGPIVEERVSDLVESDVYKEMSNPQKLFLMERVLRPIRKIATDVAKLEDPETFIKLSYKRLSKKQRRVMEEKLGGRPAFMEK